MAYRPKSGPGRLIAIVFAIGIQAVLVFALASGLVQKIGDAALQEIKATVLPPEEKPPDAPPPPPPPVDVPPPFVPPPDLNIEAPASASAPTQIQRTTVASSGIVYPKPPSLPEYPATEKRLGHEGKVIMHLCVELDGSVSEATLITSSGFPVLDQAALDWAKKVRWKPAVVAGQKQRMCYDQPYRYVLKNG